VKAKLIASIFLFLGFLALGCSQGTMTTRPSGPPPVITNFYCVNQGVYGMPIKIYLAAEDPDGDMVPGTLFKICSLQSVMFMVGVVNATKG